MNIEFSNYLTGPIECVELCDYYIMSGCVGHLFARFVSSCCKESVRVCISSDYMPPVNRYDVIFVPVSCHSQLVFNAI